MSQTIHTQSLNLIAGADLSGSQYYIVKTGSTARQVVLASAATSMLGVLQNKPNVDEVAEVAVMGTAKVIAGGTISYGDNVTVNASGKAITRTTENYILGTALEAGADGSIIEVLLNKSYIA